MNLIIFLMLSCLPMALAEISVKDGNISIVQEPLFEKKLETKALGSSGFKADLKETGFIIANAQSTYENDHFVSEWISLDPEIQNKNKILLSKVKPEKGLAYGLVTTSHDLISQIKVGQDIRINRYGLVNENIRGQIIEVVSQKDADVIQIHFLAKNAMELIAGTSCEVQVLNLKYNAYEVDLLSLLHIGIEDYIVIKQKPGLYTPKHVTVIDQNKKTATVLLPDAPGSEYVSRGAILLKPVLGQLLRPGNIND